MALFFKVMSFLAIADTFIVCTLFIASNKYDDLLNKLERIKSIVSDCSDKKCKLHSHISVIEELHDNIVYIGLDNDFYSTYQEILKKIPLQKILENGILVSMDNA